MKRNIRILVVVLSLASVAFVLVGAAPAQTDPPRVGVFFDEQGNACSGALEPFDPFGLQAHILAFVEPGTQLAGAFFRLELPPQIDVDDIVWPKNSNPVGSMTSTTGTDLQFQVCPTAADQPVLLVSFVLNDVSLGGVRTDLEIKVAGGTITDQDTLTLQDPNLKICDPEQPEGYSELVVATSTLATLNCTSGSCPCEVTAVVNTTWSAVRKLYADD